MKQYNMTIRLYDDEEMRPYDIACEPQFAECPPLYAEARLRSDDKSFDRAMACTIPPRTKDIGALIAVLSMFAAELERYKEEAKNV